MLLQTNTGTGSSCSEQGLGGRSVPGPRASQVATNYDDGDNDDDDGDGDDGGEDGDDDDGVGVDYDDSDDDDDGNDDDGDDGVCPRAKSFMSHFLDGRSAPKTGNQHLQLCFCFKWVSSLS